MTIAFGRWGSEMNLNVGNGSIQIEPYIGPHALLVRVVPEDGSEPVEVSIRPDEAIAISSVLLEWALERGTEAGIF